MMVASRPRGAVYAEQERLSNGEKMSEPPSEATKSLAGRIGGTILLAIFAVPFAHEGARRAFDGEYLKAGVAFSVAISLAVIAWVWATSSRMRAQFGRFAVNPWSWFAVLSTVLLYFAVSYMQFGKEGPQGPRGERGEQGPPGPAGTGVGDQNFGQRLASLERQVNLITPLGRYLLYDDCFSELSEINLTFSTWVKNAKIEVLNPPSPPHSFSSLSVWQTDVDAIMAVAKRCYPKKQIDLNAEPTPEEMDRKTDSDEPVGNIDDIRRYRRFFYKSRRAQNMLSQLETQLRQSKNDVRSQILGILTLDQ
jgi:hypothetical protein